MSEPTPTQQAKVLQSRALRTLIAVLVIGGMLFALRWYQEHKNDLKGAFQARVDTVGMVAAIEYGNDGDHVVAFNEKGQKIEQAATNPKARDVDPVWQPDGKYVFFASDRDGKAYQIYRWVPTPGQEPEARSQGTLGKGHPNFPTGVEKPDASMLFVSGGFVVEFDPSDLKGHQVLPPKAVGATQSAEEGGSTEGQFQGIYGELGNAFRIARWQKGTDAIVAVMTSDRGEVLIYQDLPKNGELPKAPVTIAQGSHIDFDISPSDGSIVFTTQNMQWPAGSKMPLASRFRHCVGRWLPGQSFQVLVASKDDAIAFETPAISPAGDKVLVVQGAYNRSSDSLESKALLTMPTEGNAAAGAAKLVEGGVYEPTWNPKGDAIAYAKIGSNGSRAIYVVSPDGSGEHTLTGDTGSYGHPTFSPQAKQGG